MGCWSYVILGGKKNKQSVLFITGYRPGKRSSQAGIRTAWSQQSAILFKHERLETQQEACLIDLEQWIRTYRTDNMEILLSIDANEKWTQESRIAQFADALGLINLNKEFILAATHPNIAKLSESNYNRLLFGEQETFNSYYIHSVCPV